MRAGTLSVIEVCVSRRPKEVEAARRSGAKVVGTLCRYTPVEIVYASGMVPVYPARAGDAGVDELGVPYLGSNACSYALSMIGYRKMGTEPYFKDLDAVAEAVCCMQMGLVAEYYQEYFGVEMLPISLPRRFYSDEALNLFLEELARFQKKVEQISGATIDEDRLREAIELHEAIRGHLRRIYGFLVSDTPPIRWEDAYKVVHAGFVLDKREYLTLLERLVKELESITGEARGGPRLLLMGTIVAPGDDKVIRCVDRVGGNIVMDELCTGSRWFWDPVPEPNLAGLAKRYLQGVPCAHLIHPDKAKDPWLIHVRQLVRDYRVDAVIYHTIRWCDSYVLMADSMKAELASLGVPMLQIHTTSTPMDEAQIEDNLRAFMEVLKGRAVAT